MARKDNKEELEHEFRVPRQAGAAAHRSPSRMPPLSSAAGEKRLKQKVTAVAAGWADRASNRTGCSGFREPSGTNSVTGDRR